MSHRSRASNPSIRSPESREIISDSVELCETEVCFLQCSGSKNAQDTSWGWFWFLTVASKVWVLKQTQSAMLSRVSHMTTLSEIVRVMNVRNQPCQASVTCLSPFSDWSRKLVDWPQDVKSYNSCHVQAFSDNLRANFWQFSNWFKFLLFEFIVILARTWSFVQLLHFLVCQFTVSFNACLGMSLHVVGPRNSVRVRFFPSRYFLLLQKKYVTQTFSKTVQWLFH